MLWFSSCKFVSFSCKIFFSSVSQKKASSHQKENWWKKAMSSLLPSLVEDWKLQVDVADISILQDTVKITILRSMYIELQSDISLQTYWVWCLLFVQILPPLSIIKSQDKKSHHICLRVP